MKKYLYLLVLAFLPFVYSCSDDDDDKAYKTFSVEIGLTYPEGISPAAGVAVTLTHANATVYDAQTNAEGKATFTVPVGIYEAAVSDKRVQDGFTTIYNGIKSNIVIENYGDDILQKAEITLSESKTSQLVIKELYTSGISYINDADGKQKTFFYDKYAILYNNSLDPVVLDNNLAFGIVLPYGANITNNDYINDKLFYESEGWIPAGTGVWYFTSSVTLEPGKQIVIALSNALDNTITYPGSVDLSKSEYYCTYDPEVYTHAATYPAPSQNIPTSHYLKAYHYGTGTAWPIFQNAPTFFVFKPQGRSLADFVADANENNLYNANNTQVRKKVKTEWVIDAVEVFSNGDAKSVKRLTSVVDAGSVTLTKSSGYSVYRNVDAEATKAIEGNEAKLVSGYADDPSGIDAEASIKNGARIIYKDTNNSTADFHERKKASIKD